MPHCVEVTEALRESEPGGKERIVEAQDLDHAARPADALADVSRETLRGKACCLRNVDVRRVPAVHLNAQGGVRILCDGFDGDAMNLVERLAPQNGARTAK